MQNAVLMSTYINESQNQKISIILPFLNLKELHWFMFYISTNWARYVVGWYSTRERILEIFVCFVCFISDSYLGNNYIRNAYPICTSYYLSCNRKYFGSFFRSPFITNLLVKCAISLTFLTMTDKFCTKLDNSLKSLEILTGFCALAFSISCSTIFSVLQ
jgi:hypothetical protein